MTHAEEISRAFLERHKDAHVLVFGEESKVPIEARYFSGFTTKAQREAELKAFCELIVAERALDAD